MNWTAIVTSIISCIIGPIVVLVTRRALPPKAEKHLLTYGQEVAIRACDGKYVMVNLNNNNILAAHERHVKSWEVFKIVQASSPFSHLPKKAVHYGDKVAFLATNNQNFVGASLMSEGELTAWVAHVKEWEIFTLLPPPKSESRIHGRTLRYGSFFALRACNRKNVRYNRDGDGKLRAEAPHVKNWETFVLIDPADPQ